MVSQPYPYYHFCKLLGNNAGIRWSWPCVLGYASLIEQSWGMLTGAIKVLKFKKGTVALKSMQIVLVFLIVAKPLASLACPALINAYQFPKSKLLTKAYRNQTGLFTLDEKMQWQRLPLQVNRLDQWGNIVFDKQLQLNSIMINRRDRIAIPSHDWTRNRWLKKKAPPCESQLAYELLGSAGYAYFFVCKKPLRPMEGVISYDTKKKRVFGGNYEYIHDEFNHLSFRKISLARDQLKDGFFVVAQNAEQLIRADVKKFFTLRFHNSDVSARLDQQVSGSLGLFGLLQFYLKILFFKIELSLTPEVQFYPDSLYMPMSLHSPVEAKDYLNVGSGIFYSWESPKDIVWDKERARLPQFQGKGLFDKGVLKYCRGRRCHFSMKGSFQELVFTLDFTMDRRLVKLNFFPQLILDFDSINKEFEETVSENTAGRIGVYFETSKLPKGDHYWDFWISFGPSPGKCPTRVRLKLLEI